MKEIEELYQLRASCIDMSDQLHEIEKSLKCKNLLIENLTHENEKIKADMKLIINNKQESLKHLNLSLNQKDAQLESYEIDVLDKLDKHSESNNSRINKLSLQLAEALQEN